MDMGRQGKMTVIKSVKQRLAPDDVTPFVVRDVPIKRVKFAQEFGLRKVPGVSFRTLQSPCLLHGVLNFMETFRLPSYKVPEDGNERTLPVMEILCIIFRPIEKKAKLTAIINTTV